MKVEVDALQARIIGILRDWYPITVEELRDELSLPSRVLERALKALMVRGVIALEPLTDKTYIRLLVPEAVVEAGQKAARRRARKRSILGLSDDSIMYR